MATPSSSAVTQVPQAHKAREKGEGTEARVVSSSLDKEQPLKSGPQGRSKLAGSEATKKSERGEGMERNEEVGEKGEKVGEEREAPRR